MIWPEFQTIAQVAIGRVLNSFPEGLFIALAAWAILRLSPRQNSGTRFAVWFVALLAVAALPVAGPLWMGGAATGHLAAPVGVGRPLITLPGPWGVLLFMVWALAACVAMLRLASGLWRLRGLRRNCIAIDPSELDASTRKVVADFSSSRTVTLATSENVRVPAAIGFFKPMVVIPAWALRELPAEELNIILLHEFAHLRRWDDWTNLLQKVVQAVFVFHPAVWWIESRVSLEREMACDDVVLAQTANPRGYAQCLIGLLEKSVARRGWAMAQAAVNRAREASLRLARILDANRTNSRHVWKPALGLIGAFSLLCVMVVPRSPQFVGFVSTSRALHNVHNDDGYSAIISESGFPAAAVIPAALRTSPSASKLSRLTTAKVPAHRAVAPHAAHQSVQRAVEPQPLENPVSAPQVVALRWSADADGAPLDFAFAETNQAVAPEQGLLVVQTAQRTGQNSWVLSVSVWRITWASPAQDAAGRAPAAAAKKT